MCEDNSAWMDHLKFGGSAPTFDVIAKTQEYTCARSAERVTG